MQSAKPAGEVSALPATSRDSLIWEPPGSPISVSTSPEAAELMRAEALRSAGAGKRSGGLLLGTAEWKGKPSLTIEHVETATWSWSSAPADQRELEALLARHATEGKRRVLGYYRTHPDRDLFLDAGDLVLIKLYFSDPANVFLLLHPEPNGSLTARWFFRYGEAMRSEGGEPEYPFGRPGLAASAATAGLPEPVETVRPPTPRAPYPRDLSRELDLDRLTLSEPQRAAVRQPRAPSSASVLDRLRDAAPPIRTGWLWAGLAVAACAALFYFGPARRDSPEPRGSATASSQPSTQQLGLVVEKRLNDLLLRWDRTAPAILHAQRAVLQVHDGMYIRPYQLDFDQLRTGSIYYAPLSGDVQFRLEVYDEANRPAVESIRVLSAVALGSALPPLPAVSTLPPQPFAAAPPAALPGRQRRAAQAEPAAGADRTTVLPFTPATPKRETQAPEAPPASEQPAQTRVAASAAPGVPGLQPSAPLPAAATPQQPPTAAPLTAATQQVQPPAPQPAPAAAQQGPPPAPQPAPAAAQQGPPPASQPAPAVAQQAPPPVRQPAATPPQPVPAPLQTQLQQRPARQQAAPAEQPPTSSYVPPLPVKQVQPAVSQSVRSMLKSEINIAVRVYIDGQGKVTRAEVAGQKGPLSGFVLESALNAARRWQFKPATAAGRGVPSDMVLNFRFLP